MKLTKRVLSVAILSVMGAAYLPTAEAGVSATVSGANMYLWRGLSISNPSPEFSGSLDYSHDSGLFAGAWTSSEGVAGSSETDFYAGYKGKSGEFTYGATLWQYIYPGAPEELEFGQGGGAPSEWQVSLGYGPVAFSVLVDTNNSDNQYYTLSYTYDKFSATLGTWMLTEELQDTEYSHLDLFYQATPEIKFGVSKVVDPYEYTSVEDQDVVGTTTVLNIDGDPVSIPTLTTESVEVTNKQDSDPLFYVSYTKTFDL